MKLAKRILIALLFILVAMQFIRIDKDNPVSDPKEDFIEMLQPPSALANILKVSCYDCHSNHTVYPWYTSVAPISFWIKNHVRVARKHLNFSEWGQYSSKRAHHKLEECYEEVEEGHMPLPSYLWMHAEAKLTDGQRSDLANWFKNQMIQHEQRMN